MKYRGNATSVRKGNATTGIGIIDVTGGVRSSGGPGGKMEVQPTLATYYPELYGTVPDSVTLNGVQTSLTYDGMLRVSTSTGPEAVTAFTYDTLSRPTSRVLPDGSSARIEYSFSPAMTKEIVRNRWTKSYLDGLGRVVKTERGHGGVQLPPGQTVKPEVTESVTETEYAPCACSPFGKPWRMSRLHQPGAAIAWSTTSYDELGRVTQVLHAPVTGTAGSSGTTLYDYDVYAGILSVVTVTDPGGRWKRSQMDARGQLREVEEPNPAGGSHLSSYGYNALGQMLKYVYDATTQRLIHV